MNKIHNLAINDNTSGDSLGDSGKKKFIYIELEIKKIMTSYF